MKIPFSFFTILLSLVTSFSWSQEAKKEKPEYASQNQVIKWISIEEAEELQKQQPRKVIIDMYTDWCGWCKKMDAETFSHPNIAAYINQNYYAVKFDAETRDTIVFKGKTYVNEQASQLDPQGRPKRKPSHQLAIELLGGKMSYPTIVYLDENMSNLSPVPGYRSPSDIEPFLMYFAENVYKYVPYDNFDKYFKMSFKDSVQPDTTRVKWYSLEDALKMNTEKPKKIFIDLYVPWSSMNRMMFLSTYTNQAIAEYLNENYYPVRFDATSDEKISVFEQELINEKKGHPYHQFAVMVLQGKMRFPSYIFMGPDNKMITAVPEYRSPETIEPILHFISEDKYMDTQFPDYLKTFQSKIKK